MDGSLRILKRLMLLSLIISLTSGYKNSGRRRHTLRHHTLHKREVRNERPVRQLEESADEWGGMQGEGRSFGGYGGVVASKVSEHQSKTPSSPKSGDEAKQAAKEKAEEGARKGRAVGEDQHNRRAEFLEEEDLELSREARKISSEEHHHGHGRHHGSHHGRRSRPRHGSGHDISQESHSAEYGSDEGYHH